MRELVLLFMLINFFLCFYVGIQLFRTADFLQNAMNTLQTLSFGTLTDLPDFLELKALAIYVVLLGISGLALAYWVSEDSSNIQKLMHARRFTTKTKREQKYPEEVETEKIGVLECPQCGEEVAPDFEFCPFCGYELKLTVCPECGKEVSKTFSVCPYCGAKLKEIKK